LKSFNEETSVNMHFQNEAGLWLKLWQKNHQTRVGFGG